MFLNPYFALDEGVEFICSPVGSVKSHASDLIRSSLFCFLSDTDEESPNGSVNSTQFGVVDPTIKPSQEKETKAFAKRLSEETSKLEAAYQKKISEVEHRSDEQLKQKISELEEAYKVKSMSNREKQAYDIEKLKGELDRERNLRIAKESESLQIRIERYLLSELSTVTVSQKATLALIKQVLDEFEVKQDGSVGTRSDEDMKAWVQKKMADYPFYFKTTEVKGWGILPSGSLSGIRLSNEELNRQVRERFFGKEG